MDTTLGTTSMRQLALDLVDAPVASFENFVMGRNAEALTYLKDVLKAQTERFIYLWGEPGCGRTHLLQSVAAAHESASYVHCEPDSVFSDSAPLLLVDEVDRLGAQAQHSLFIQYNRLRETGGCLIASGPVPPVQLALRADVLTRLAWGLVFQIHALNDEEKAKALEQQAWARGWKLSAEAIAYLLTHVARDMGALYGVVQALDRYSLETKRAVTIPLIRQWLLNNPS